MHFQTICQLRQIVDKILDILNQKRLSFPVIDVVTELGDVLSLDDKEDLMAYGIYACGTQQSRLSDGFVKKFGSLALSYTK